MRQIDDRFIGRGEKSALSILKKIFPSADIQIQFPFRSLMNEEFFGSLSDRQKKETLDIVVFQYANPTLVIRVQDKTHVGTMKSLPLLDTKLCPFQTERYPSNFSDAHHHNGLTVGVPSFF